MENIFKFNLYELTSIVKKEYNAKDFVAKQIWSWLYCKGSRNFDSMLNLSKKLRNDLQKIFNCDRPKIIKDFTSFDGTKKWLLELNDQETIELVYIPSKDRGTLCISSQVGCPMGCKFCNTGAQGFIRNLEVHEIVQQIILAKDILEEWDNMPKEEYLAKKHKLAEDLFKKAEKYFPNLKDHVEYFEVSTPKTIKRYMKTPSGTAYGYKNNNYLRKGRVPRFSRTIKNLLFTGAYAFPGGGFTGVLISGYMAAMNVIEPLRIHIIRRLIITTIICTGISTAYKWIPALLSLLK